MRIDIGEGAASGGVQAAAPARIEIWGGLECTVARIGDDFRDLLAETGHRDRPEDLDAIAALGIRTLRYPVLWEHIAPEAPDKTDWRWHDDRLARLARLGITPIVGLLHHGSGPRYTDLLDPRFPELLADFAEKVARRYPDAAMFTPVNEPVTTARFSCLYGLWYPHTKDSGCFLRALFNECHGTALAMRRIRRVTPEAKLVLTEDIGKTFSTPMLRHMADYQNQRRWLSLDLLCGWVDRDHPWFGEFIAAGVPEAALRDLSDAPCPPDIVGINYYLSTDRFLDQRLKRYPRSSWGGNGSIAYADVEAVRVARADLDIGVAARLREVWHRYRLPLAVTEVHNGCTREEQLRWLAEIHDAAVGLRNEGVDLRAITVWSLIGSVDWHAMLTRRDGHYECGPFELAALQPAPPDRAGKSNRSFDQRPTVRSPGT